MSLLIRSARVLPMTGASPRRGAAIAQLDAIDSTDVRIEGDQIVAVGPDAAASPTDIVIDASGKVLMPGFVDCHTHACWAGDRLDEWEAKLKGATYLELLNAGGGIMSTVRDVRKAGVDELATGLLQRLDRMLRDGTTTAEVKSGYGLSTADELKMLEAIADASARWAGTVVPTACIGHAIDPDADGGFIERTIDETLTAVHDAFPGITIDAYCESGAWSLENCLRLFDRAMDLGHPIRVHADQFNSLGMIPEAITRGFVSVDHLEASTADDIERLANSDVFGVALPCSGFHVDGRYAPGRAFVDAGGALAIATNFNPGSAPCGSIPMAMALAVRELGLTPGEAIHAATVNAAAVLGFDDRAAIQSGRQADLVLLSHKDERQLTYEFGGSHVDAVICGGRVLERTV